MAAWLCVPAHADPSDFDPLKHLIGTWTGKVEIVTTDNRGDTRVSYTKTSECKISKAGDSLLMFDTEVNPWTNKKYTTDAVIKFDRLSKTFKSMASGSDGSVRLFVIRVIEDAFVYDLVDRAVDVKFKSMVSLREDGTLLEEGSRTGLEPIPYAETWSVHYTKDGAKKGT